MKKYKSNKKYTISNQLYFNTSDIPYFSICNEKSGNIYYIKYNGNNELPIFDVEISKKEYYLLLNSNDIDIQNLLIENVLQKIIDK